MTLLRALIFHPETFRFFMFTLAFVLLAVAFVVRLIRKEYAPTPSQPMRGYSPPPATATAGPNIAPPPGAPESVTPLVSEPHAIAETAARAAEVSIPEPPSARVPGPPLPFESELPAPAEAEAHVYTSPREPVVPAAIPEPSSIPAPPLRPEVSPSLAGTRDRFSFELLQSQPSLAADLFRGILALLALSVLAGFIIVLLPQGVFDRVADSIRIRKSPLPPQDTIALLYLGEEAKGSEFHIRGVVRNITTRAVEQLDANVRLYAPDRTLLESAIVRMDIDLIPPDATASFNLSYPDYHGQFGSYSIDFKLRQGDPVPYRDMRAPRAPE